MRHLLSKLDPTKGNPILMLVGAIVVIDALAPRTITEDLRKLRRERKGEALALALWIYYHTEDRNG